MLVIINMYPTANIFYRDSQSRVSTLVLRFVIPFALLFRERTTSIIIIEFAKPSKLLATLN